MDVAAAGTRRRGFPRHSGNQRRCVGGTSVGSPACRGVAGSRKGDLLDDSVRSPAACGPQQRFTRFIGPHLAAMRAYARRLAGQDSDAEDLIQDVLLKLYRQEPRLATVLEPRPWLMRVVYHQAIDGQRQRRLERGLEFHGLMGDADDADSGHRRAWTSEAPGPEDLADQTELRGFIAAALEQLPSGQREVLQLHDVCGLTLAEISARQRVSLNTLKSALSRGRCNLRAQLGLCQAAGLLPGRGTALPMRATTGRYGSRRRRRRGVEAAQG